MEAQAIGSIGKYFGDLCDPRRGNAKQHLFLEIVIIAICAVICGADGWADVELFGKNKKAWLKTFLQLPKGIPSHDTFGRVFAKIKPDEFEKRFIAWVQAIETLTQGQVIAVDGKQLRRSHQRQAGKAAIYMVSAWATDNQLVLGQRKVADRSNEITAIPELLGLLEISGCIVTIDAIGTQKEIAKVVIAGGGDYLLSVKENQGKLWEDLQYLFTVEEAQGANRLPGSHAVGVLLDEGLAGAGLMGRTLLDPLSLLGLDRDEAVGGDAVATAQLPEADLGSDELALELGEVVTLVRSDRLGAVPASAVAK